MELFYTFTRLSIQVGNVRKVGFWSDSVIEVWKVKFWSDGGFCSQKKKLNELKHEFSFRNGHPASHATVPILSGQSDLNLRILMSQLSIILRKCLNIFSMDQSLPPIILFPQKPKPWFHISTYLTSFPAVVASFYSVVVASLMLWWLRLRCGDIVFDCCSIVFDWRGIVFNCCGILVNCCGIVFGCCGVVFVCCGIVFVFCGIVFVCCGIVFSCFEIVSIE